MKNKLTPEMIRKVISILREYKVQEPYYVQVENPRIFRGKLISITDFFKR